MTTPTDDIPTAPARPRIRVGPVFLATTMAALLRDGSAQVS